MAITGFTEGWSLDRSSGNEAGLVSLLATANGSPGQAVATGVGGFCRTFNGSSQYFAVTDHANIPQGDIDWTGHALVSITDKSGFYIFLGKDASGQRDWTAYYDDGADDFAFSLFNNSGLIATVHASNFGSPAVDTFYSIQFGHSAADDVIFIRVNGSTLNTAATGGAVPGSGSADMCIGRRSFSGFENYFKGKIKEVLLYKNQLIIEDDDHHDLYVRRGRPRRAA